MYTIITLYILLLLLSFIAMNSISKKTSPFLSKIFHLTLFLFLLLFATFREGNLLPDYNNYIMMFRLNNVNKHVETSFYMVCSFVKCVSHQGEYLLLFIYACLGVGLKYYAIKKYAPYVMFSICVWISSFFILQDMIQMRASVAGGLLLIIVPLIQQRKIYLSLVLTFIAFLFHNSAIIFLPIFFMNTKNINWKFWTAIYIVAFTVNIMGINFSRALNAMLSIIPSHSINLRIASYLTHEYVNNSVRVSMFAPYILLQSATCFITMFFIDRLKSVTPFAVLLVKVSFFSIIIYSMSIPGVSMRLAELLSIVTIYLYTLLINCFPVRYKYIGGGIVILISFLLITNFIFLKHFIAMK